MNVAPRIAVCFGRGDDETAAWVRDLAAALPHAVVGADVPSADYAVVWRAPQAFFDGQPRLKAIFAAGAGVDALLAQRLPPGVPVVRLEDAGMGEQMADHVSHALLHHFRHAAHYAHEQAAGRWSPRAAEDKRDWSVGVMGLGQLGRAVAQRVRALGFPVAGWARSAHAIAGVETFAGASGFAPFLARTRVLVDVLPLTGDTRDLIDAECLAQLRAPAYVINVARGAHIVESDLLDALDGGQVAGASLDVCRDEPPPPGHPFWTHPRVVLTPHIAAMTLRDVSVVQIAEKLAALQRGEAIGGVISHERGY